jgi:hypothetical protein
MRECAGKRLLAAAAVFAAQEAKQGRMSLPPPGHIGDPLEGGRSQQEEGDAVRDAMMP